MANQILEDWRVTAETAVAKTREEAGEAVDSYLNLLQKTISSYPSGGTELGEKLKDYVEKNIAAARDYMRKLSQAKDFQDVIRIQTELMQSQLRHLASKLKALAKPIPKQRRMRSTIPLKKSLD